VLQFARFIKTRHDAKIVAVDAALGNELFSVKVFKGGLVPAAAAGAKLLRVGDYAVTATVNYPCGDSAAALKSVSLKTVGEMAETTAGAIADALTLYNAQKTITCTRFL
jgi:hypothetical protein